MRTGRLWGDPSTTSADAGRSLLHRPMEDTECGDDEVTALSSVSHIARLGNTREAQKGNSFENKITQDICGVSWVYSSILPSKVSRRLRRIPPLMQPGRSGPAVGKQGRSCQGKPRKSQARTSLFAWRDKLSTIDRPRRAQRLPGFCSKIRIAIGIEQHLTPGVKRVKSIVCYNTIR